VKGGKIIICDFKAINRPSARAFITSRRHLFPMKQDQGSVETLKYQDGSDDVHFAHLLIFTLDYYKPDAEDTELSYFFFNREKKLIEENYRFLWNNEYH